MRRMKGRFRLLAMAAALFCSGFAPCFGAEEADAKAFEAFARKIDETMNAGDASLFDKGFDVDLLMDRMFGGLGIPPARLSAFRQGFAPSFKLGAQIAANMGEDGTYCFLRLRKRDGRPTALFRMNLDDGLNYHELYLVSVGGEVKVEDIYVYAMGEDLSATMRRMALPVLTMQEPGLLDKLTGVKDESLKHLNLVSGMSRLVRSGNAPLALQAYAQMPPALKKDKTVLMLRLQAAAALGTDTPEYQQAMQAFQKHYPGDPALQLILTDYYLNLKRYDDCLKSIDAIDASVGGDPYLHTLRANVYCAWRKFPEARAHVDKAIAGTRITEPHWVRVSIALESEDWPTVSESLTRLAEEFGVEFENLEEVEEYAGYVKSPAYKTWLAERAKARPDANKKAKK